MKSMYDHKRREALRRKWRRGGSTHKKAIASRFVNRWKIKVMGKHAPTHWRRFSNRF